MKIRLLSLCLAGAATIAVIGCRADAADDQFARKFIDRLVAGDSATGFAQLQPGSAVGRKGWSPIARGVAAQLTAARPDSVRLIEWERGNDDDGPYRKLTYQVTQGSKQSHVELWLVTVNERTYVNTVRLQSGAPNP